MILEQRFNKIIFCTISGLLAVSAFPKMNLFFLIWIAFVPLIFVIMRTGVKNSFFYSFITGLVFNAIGLYWLIHTLQFNMNSYLQAIIAVCILLFYLALYWGTWGMSICLAKNIIQKAIGNELYSTILIIFFGASMWVLLEYIRTYFLTGFPWMLIGYSQFQFIEIIQISEFTGVYGVSFLVIFCNLCFYFWISISNGKKYLYIALILNIVIIIFGAFRADRFRFFGNKEFTVSIVQPNIDQYKKWDIIYEKEVLSKLKKYSHEIAKNKTDLVLWPETVITKIIPDNAKNIANIAGGFNLVGSMYNDENYKLYNVVLAFEKDIIFKKVHKKNHLVPFGEFIPFRGLLSKFFAILNKFDDLTKGSDTNVFDNGEIYVGSTICSENFFSDISRRFVLAGAKVLTNHTNDAWFFNTAAPHQHFMMNIFRAIENRKAVMVSANSGISGIVEASGVIIAKTISSKNILLRGIFFQNDFITFYTKYGDLFVDLCAIFVMIIFVFLYLFLILTDKK
ncbi:MAG: apolipoprotein N-acyltransferase [Endomicrobium sp.]|jgi:apolipoprotein N-acyltransferase|nr:apolipoprotein N-acyltransferase [Endomicrobium sp.]